MAMSTSTEPGASSAPPPCHQFRRRGAGQQHRTDDEIRIDHFALDCFAGREHSLHGAQELLVELAQALDGTIDDGDVGAQAMRHFDRVRAGNTAADHDHLRGRHAGHAT
jgi:hypothetical protein